MSQPVYPTTYDGRNHYYTVVVPYLDANASRLTIDPADLSNLNMLYNNNTTDIGTMGWIQLWVIYSDKKGARYTAAKDELLGRDSAIRHLLSVIYNNIPQRKWSKADRDTTGRKGPNTGHKPQTTGTEKTVGTAAVVADLEPEGKDALILHIKQAGGQKGTSRKKEGKEKNVREYVFHYLIHKATEAYPTDLNNCTFHEIVTRLPHKINFPPSQAGMRCSGFVQVIEKPAKAGIIGQMITAIIPG